MKPTPYQHFIFVRPPGSHTWTLHMKSHKDDPRITGSVPFRTGDAADANKEAQNIVEHSGYCAIVVPVQLPQDMDEKQYALLADGDTLYMPTEPVLWSKQIGGPVP